LSAAYVLEDIARGSAITTVALCRSRGRQLCETPIMRNDVRREDAPLSPDEANTVIGFCCASSNSTCCSASRVGSIHCLGLAEALRDDVAQVVVDDVLAGVVHVRVVVAPGQREQDLRARRGRVRPLDVEGHLRGSADLVAVLDVECRHALGRDLLELRVGQPERGVEDLQVFLEVGVRLLLGRPPP